MDRIGILLNRHILLRIVRGRPTFERADLYMQAAERLGVGLVFFSVSGVDGERGWVKGYVPATGGGLEPAVVPIPRVIHNRALYARGRDPHGSLRRLAEQGIMIFNPPMALDKYRIHKLLETNPTLTPYLPEVALLRPENFPWYRRQLLQRGELFIKPRHGSLGLGIIRIRKDPQDRWRHETLRSSRVTSLRGAWNQLLARSLRGRVHRYFMQQGIRLAEDGGRRFDLRIPVQADGTDRWSIVGMVARRADRHPFLTNLARGGRALEGRAALERVFGSRGMEVERIVAHIEQVAVAIAETLRAYDPRFVDIGLDVGLDEGAHPYLIEVNRRDLRITLRESGQHQAHAAAYGNPIAYAARVLENLDRPGRSY